MTRMTPVAKKLTLNLGQPLVDRIWSRASEVGYVGPYSTFVTFLIERGLEADGNPAIPRARRAAAEPVATDPETPVSPYANVELSKEDKARCGECDAELHVKDKKCWQCGHVFVKGS